MDYNIDEEVWKDVKGYEGIYKISNKGNIWSCQRKRMRIPRLVKGYLSIRLDKDTVTFSTSVHRLVALHFVDNPLNKPQVNHLDENKFNNCAENLVWCTAKENANWGTRNKRISEYQQSDERKNAESIKRNSLMKKVHKIDIDSDIILETYDSISEAARANGSRQSNISDVCRGRKITSHGFKWAYGN